MTAYTYAYNVNSILSQRTSHLISCKQTNVHDAYESVQSLDQLASSTLHVPKKSHAMSGKLKIGWHNLTVLSEVVLKNLYSTF